MRLIDADELFDVVETYKDEMCDEPQVAHYILNLICKAPTIDPWHYPSKGELPNCTQEVLIVYGMEQHMKLVMWRQDFGRFGSLLPIEITAWQYIQPPQED